MYYVEGRVRLRHIEANLHDAYLVVKWRNTTSARTNFFTPDVVTPDTHFLFMRNRAPHDLVFVVETAESNFVRAIGMIALTVDTRRCTGEFGRTFVDENWRGKGYATEIEYTLMSYAFDLLKLKSLWLDAYVSNKVAIALRHKIGWQDAGVDLLGHTDTKGAVIHQTYLQEWWVTHREVFIEQFGVRLPK